MSICRFCNMKNVIPFYQCKVCLCGEFTTQHNELHKMCKNLIYMHIYYNHVTENGN